MIVAFFGLMLADGWLDGTISVKTQAKLPVNATIFAILITILAIPAQMELKRLLAKTGAKIFPIITIPATMLIVLMWYIWQFKNLPLPYIKTPIQYLFALTVITFWAVFFIQAMKYKTENVIFNISTNIFAVFYLGIFTAFVLGIRIEFGLWALMMYIFTLKSTDIGAYFVGRNFGKTKFAPSISPGKSWEGMIGGIIFSIITASLFAHFAHIMPVWIAIIFGLIMAFLGQFSDLAESMIKRDAQQKDSDNSIPGFGGILDVIDSLLLASPAAYVFFGFLSGK